VADAQAAYDVAPGNIFAADALAWALHSAGKDEQALALSDQSLSLGVRRASFLFLRGMIADSLGRTAEAKGFLQEALEVTPNFSVLHAPTARATLARLAG
jgi:tetratricopeptide (TPR) repeat protein